jgi:hypothetical protein
MLSGHGPSIRGCPQAPAVNGEFGWRLRPRSRNSSKSSTWHGVIGRSGAGSRTDLNLKGANAPGRRSVGWSVPLLDEWNALRSPAPCPVSRQLHPSLTSPPLSPCARGSGVCRRAPRRSLETMRESAGIGGRTPQSPGCGRVHRRPRGARVGRSTRARDVRAQTLAVRGEAGASWRFARDARSELGRGDGRHHRRAPRARGVADLLGVDPLQFEAGVASGLINVPQLIGGALELAIVATMANNRTVDALAAASSRRWRWWPASSPVPRRCRVRDRRVGPRDGADLGPGLARARRGGAARGAAAGRGRRVTATRHAVLVGNPSAPPVGITE